MGEFLRISILFLGISVLVRNLVAQAKRKLTPTLSVVWSIFAVFMIVLGFVVSFSDIDRYVSPTVIVLLVMALYGITFSIYHVCIKMSELTDKVTELTMQVSLLNSENVRYQRERYFAEHGETALRRRIGHSEKQKVLFIINTMGRGGAETALNELLSRPEMNDSDVDLYVMLGQGELIDKLPGRVRVLNKRYDNTDVLSKDGMKRAAKHAFGIVLRRGAIIRNIPYILGNYSDMKKKNNVQKDKLLWRAVAQGTKPLDKEYDLAVAYIEGASTYFVADTVKAKRKIAFVHNDYSSSGHSRKLDRGCYDAFDKIFCVSEEVCASMAEVYPEYRNKIEVFHNFVSRDRILDLAGRGEGFDDGFKGVRILTVGRLVKQKAVEISAAAMKILKDRGIQARWYVLGEGEDRPNIETAVKSLGLKKDFLLPGIKDNPYPYYRQADIYVHCSRYEGWGIAIQEAQTLGCPVIVSDCSSCRKLVTDGVDGLIVELDPKAIADAVEKLLNDPSFRDKLAGRAASKQFVNEDIRKLFE